jgi:hypothetical protein
VRLTDKAGLEAGAWYDGTQAKEAFSDALSAASKSEGIEYVSFSFAFSSSLRAGLCTCGGDGEGDKRA